MSMHDTPLKETICLCFSFLCFNCFPYSHKNGNVNMEWVTGEGLCGWRLLKRQDHQMVLDGDGSQPLSLSASNYLSNLLLHVQTFIYIYIYIYIYILSIYNFIINIHISITPCVAYYWA